MDITDLLTKVWKNSKPKQFAKIFKDYAISRGLKQYSYSNKDNTNTYFAHSTCGGRSWNRVNCYYLSESERFSDANLAITLRKKAGDYFIIEYKGKRVFECDSSGIKHYDEKLLNKIIKEHVILFDELLKVAN